MPASSPDKLLVVLPNWVGDVVLATPVLRTLRQTVPEMHITYLCRPYVRDVLYGCGWNDELLEWPDRRLRTFRRVAAELRAERMSGALLLTNSFRSAALCWLARIPRRIGYDRDYRGLLLTERLQPRRDGRRFTVESMLTYYGRLLEHIAGHGPAGRVELHADSESDTAVQRWWDAHDLGTGPPVVLLNPGGRFGASKIYPAAQFAEVADSLVQQHGVRILISGGPEDRPMVEAVAGTMSEPSLTLLPPELNLRKLKSVVSRAALLITNDTGARHFAIAMNTPVITLFGPTHPGWTETHFDLERQIQVPIECGPCQKPVCPLGHQECMKRITPHMVTAAACELLPPSADAVQVSHVDG